MTRPATPGQTVGPFFAYSLPFDGDDQLVPPGSPNAVRLHGYVLDGAGDPVPDALVEIWQPASNGALVTAAGSLRRDGWTFTGFGRSATDPTGHWGFTTLAPGSSTGGAPFYAVTVFARGLLDRLFTRAYLPANAALDHDPLLASLPADRRATLIATADELGHRFDIRLQGANETVFIDFGAAGRPERLAPRA